ncbi:MAG: methyltransferase domain-containing protein, partial [Nostoc sp.]|uniref:class I SAM-dependent methyltransferase n=1 Tax=Nostoc sp. TaxID=1180 RepID=UPI002FF76060
AIKTWLKTNPLLYRTTKAILNKVISTPYLLKSFNPQPLEKSLIIGFSGKLNGWVTFDIAPGADYLGNIKNLKLFSSNSMNRVYASHVLEHVSSHDAKVALKEMYRVLKPQGEVFIAVPDLVNVSKLLETEFAQTAIDITFGVNRPVKDWQPQHKYGYTQSTLKNLLKEVGFTNIEEFCPFLEDTSQLFISNIKISICLKAKKGGLVNV